MISKHYYYLVLLLALIFFALELAAKEPMQNTGMITFVDGVVKKQVSEAVEWKSAAKDTTLGSGDKVRTMVNSRAELELRELDVIRLAPRTTIDIVKLYDDTKTHKDQTQIDVVEGDIWAMVNTVDAGAEFTLNTPVAGAAIKGTVFRISVGDDASTQLKVYEGEVRIGNAIDNPNVTAQNIPTGMPVKATGPNRVAGPREVTLNEWVRIVNKMQVINIDKNGNYISAGDFSPDDHDEQSDWVQWNLDRDGERNH